MKKSILFSAILIVFSFLISCVGISISEKGGHTIITVHAQNRGGGLKQYPVGICRVPSNFVLTTKEKEEFKASLDAQIQGQGLELSTEYKKVFQNFINRIGASYTVEQLTMQHAAFDKCIANINANLARVYAKNSGISAKDVRLLIDINN